MCWVLRQLPYILLFEIRSSGKFEKTTFFGLSFFCKLIDIYLCSRYDDSRDSYVISNRSQTPQCLPEKPKNYAKDFAKVDQILDSLHFAEDKKITVYKCIAAILHLGNIEFENNGTDGETYVIGTTEPHIRIAADLLDLPSDELKNELLCHSMQVYGSPIK